MLQQADYDQMKSAYEWKLNETAITMKLPNNILAPNDPFVLKLIQDHHLDGGPIARGSNSYGGSVSDWKQDKQYKYVRKNRLRPFNLYVYPTFIKPVIYRGNVVCCYDT